MLSYFHCLLLFIASVEVMNEQSFSVKLTALRSTFLYKSIGFSLAAVAFYMQKTVHINITILWIMGLFLDVKYKAKSFTISTLYFLRTSLQKLTFLYNISNLHNIRKFILYSSWQFLKHTVKNWSKFIFKYL
jgi:hypothetical protein